MSIREILLCAALLCASALPLAGCADRWSETAPDGTRFADAEPACRAQAQASARRQLPFAPLDWSRGMDPTGLPPDSRYDIERRETALCLKQKGFTMTREWQ